MKEKFTLCTRCKKNAAIMYQQDSSFSSLENVKGFCPLCAKELHLPNYENVFQTLGITEENLEEKVQQFNAMRTQFEYLGDEKWQAIQDVYQELQKQLKPEEFASFQAFATQGNLPPVPFEAISDFLKAMENTPLEKASEEDEEIEEYNENGEDAEDFEEDELIEFEEIEENLFEEEEIEEKLPPAPKPMASPVSDEKKKKRKGLSWLQEVLENLDPNTPGMISIVQSHEPFFPPREEHEETSGRKYTSKKKIKFLSEYGTHLNALAAEGKIDRVIGREKELLRVIQILNRRSKNNPVLLGDPGVGKTALAEGLALKIHAGEVPEKLKNMQVYLLDMAGMVAGTQFRGQFENRLKGVMDEATAHGNIILVIDELHNIVGAGNAEGAMNAANILKPALAKGTLHVLGSTTLEEYRRFIEKDSALERRFQQVLVEEPTPAETIEILKKTREYYEKYHHVTYSDQVIVETVELAKRYITDRFFPDKAIDLIDEAGSKSNLEQTELVKKQSLEEELARLEAELQKVEEKYIEASTANQDTLTLLEEKAHLKESYAKRQAELDALLEGLHPREITLDNIAKVVELWTGIPVMSLTENEKEKLLHLEKRLKERVIGQDQAVESLAKAIRRKRSGFGNKKKPNSFLFVGPTGVGKTELVKTLATVLFGDEKSLIRFDMSEFMEAHTVSKWIGSPPGYVGFEEAGQLTEQVRRRPYSVVLLDEIEKAHKDVYHMLLQILDDGRLTDSKGRTVHFENTVFIMTSNAGTSYKHHAFGFEKRQAETMEKRVKDALEELFRPELLNRIDETILFSPLSKEKQREILQLMLKEIQEEVANHGLSLIVEEDAIDFLLEKGYSETMGARPMRRTLARELEDLLAEAYLKNEMEAKTKVFVSHNQEENTLQLRFS